MIPYAGIGSRETPTKVLAVMGVLAAHLAQRGLTLRSGGAPGADQAFERGCDNAQGKKEIFLPWKGFEKNPSLLHHVSTPAILMAEKFHRRQIASRDPNRRKEWDQLTQGTQKLKARNCYQVLGPRLDDPSKFVLCYTENGSGAGGTGLAIMMADEYQIPVYDLGVTGNMSTAKIQGFLDSCLG